MHSSIQISGSIARLKPISPKAIQLFIISEKLVISTISYFILQRSVIARKHHVQWQRNSVGESQASTRLSATLVGGTQRGWRLLAAQHCSAGEFEWEIGNGILTCINYYENGLQFSENPFLVSIESHFLVPRLKKSFKGSYDHKSKSFTSSSFHWNSITVHFPTKNFDPRSLCIRNYGNSKRSLSRSSQKRINFKQLFIQSPWNLFCTSYSVDMPLYDNNIITYR